MSKRMNILVVVALVATVGVVGCGSGKSTTPEDNVAPAAVEDLAGVVHPGLEVELSWKVGPEVDLDGYRIYRSVEGGASTLVAETNQVHWMQQTAPGDYTYEVSAFDTSDNESPRSSVSVAVSAVGSGTERDHAHD